MEENQGAGSEVWLSCLHDVCDKKAWAAHQKQVAERFPPKPNAIVKDTISSLAPFVVGDRYVQNVLGHILLQCLSLFSLCLPSLQQEPGLMPLPLVPREVCDRAGNRSCLTPTFLPSFVKP